jgi:transcriptional regulator with XRE-family HTH domain
MTKNSKVQEVIPGDLLRTIGKNLFTIRTDKNEEIKNVASALEIKPEIIEKIESGIHELPLTILVKLCNHYNVTIQQVLELEISQIYHFTQTNSAGNNHKQYVVNDHTNGYELLVDQLQSEVKYFRGYFDKYMALVKGEK